MANRVAEAADLLERTSLDSESRTQWTQRIDWAWYNAGDDRRALVLAQKAAGVLVFGIIVEGISMRACLQEVNKARGDRSLWQWFRGSRQADLAVIFGEDLAELLVSGFAIAAVMLGVGS